MTMFGSQWLDNPSRGYDIDQSIRFNDGDSPYLTRTPGSGATDNRKFTVSMWLKRTTLTVDHVLFSTPTGNGRTQTYFDDSDKLNFGFYDGADNRSLVTNMQFRDTAAWYHVVWAFDIDNATAASRLRLYVNGSEADGTRNNPNTGVDSLWMNNGDVNDIGRQNPSTNAYFDGYMAEIHSIDGQALNGTSFGKTNGDGVWIPKKYSGAYGTNGFFIDGRDSSDLGDDESGNGNDFASSGLAANDQVSDSPTNNWCIMNSLSYDSTQITLSDGNLTLAWNTPNGDGGTTALSTFDISQHGKSYWEFSAANSSVCYSVGVCTNTSVWRKPRTQDAFAELRYGVSDASTAEMQVLSGDGSIDSTGVLAITGSEVGMMAFDPATGKLWVGQDGTFFNSGDPAGGTDEQGTFTGDNNTGIFVNVRDFNSDAAGAVTFNFGQSGFAHTPPTGYTALNSDNASSVAIEDGSEYFHTQLYTGTGSSGLEITNDANAGDFKPDWFWVSPRSNGDNDIAIDVARGVTSRLKVNGSDAQDTDGTALFTFETDGFHVDSTDVNFNGDGRTYVAWQWKTQGGAGSSNTDGTINTTTTSVNTTAGFSISTFAGTGANATVGHGLGLVPKMIILKNRADDVAWVVYHVEAGNTHGLALNDTGARADDATFFNDTTPTSSVFSIGSSNGTNGDGDAMVAYCFAEIPGYSKFGSFEGNAATYGPFIHLGFKPAWFMWKNMDSGTNGDWTIMDSKRDPFNMVEENLRANSNSTADTGEADLDFCAAGVKHRSGVSNRFNAASTYIYMAFAENPFVGDGVAPATAR